MRVYCNTLRAIQEQLSLKNTFEKCRFLSACDSMKIDAKLSVVNMLSHLLLPGLLVDDRRSSEQCYNSLVP